MRKLKKIAILLGAVNLILAAGLIALYFGEITERDPLAKLIGPEIRQMTDAQREEARLQLLSEGIRNTYYNPEPELKDGQINLFLSNGDENSYGFSAELTVIETGEAIAQTGVIYPGYRVEQLPCGAEMEKGEYECLLSLLVYAADGTELGRVGRHLTLSVQ